jgi:iron transport multicopper oxidase
MPLTVINVERGTRYRSIRFRIIAMSCKPNFLFSIDGRNFIIIEADRKNTQVLTGLLVDSLQIFARQ